MNKSLCLVRERFTSFGFNSFIASIKAVRRLVSFDNRITFSTLSRVQWPPCSWNWISRTRYFRVDEKICKKFNDEKNPFKCSVQDSPKLTAKISEWSIRTTSPNQTSIRSCFTCIQRSRTISLTRSSLSCENANFWIVCSNFCCYNN